MVAANTKYVPGVQENEYGIVVDELRESEVELLPGTLPTIANNGFVAPIKSDSPDFEPFGSVIVPEIVPVVNVAVSVAFA